METCIDICERSHVPTTKKEPTIHTPPDFLATSSMLTAHRSDSVGFLWIAFFLSGIAGLSYELTWVRYLTHLFGSSTPAVSATVSVFFGGLALGSAVGGRFFDRMRSPLRGYAYLEIMIGLTAACVPYLFSLTETFLSQQIKAGGETPLLLLAVSGALLLIPTSLLGATFPAMAASLKEQVNTTYSTGFFYGLNTLGAVLGCLFVSFWWLPTLGQNATTWCMTTINFGIAAIVFAKLRYSPASLHLPTPPAQAASTTAPAPADADVDAPASTDVHIDDDTYAPAKTEPPLPANLALLLASLSGCLSIGTEVLWTRALSLTFPASVYVFAIVLAAYLVGIGVGSLWVGAISRKHPPSRSFLLLLYLLIGVGSLLALYLFPRLMPWSLKLLRQGWLNTWMGYIGWVGFAAVLAMLLATLAMGAALPLLIGLSTQSKAKASQIAGKLYALNTIGGVFGSVGVTFFLMPLLGLSRSLMLLLLGYIGLALLLVLWLKTRPTLLFLTCGFFGVGGFMLASNTYPQVNPYKHRHNQRLIFYHDASSATIAIYEDRKGVRALRVNNHYGLSHTGRKTVKMQYRLGHIPLLLHPSPQKSLLIGFATGTTLSAMAEHPLERADCVELHGLLLELAPYFRFVNNGVWNNKKVRLIVDDGRRYLLRPGDRYDLIVGDLYLPRNPGVGALYSLEHFQAASRKLNKGGLFVSWLPLFQLGPSQTASIIRTFLKVYPHAEGWVGNWNPGSPIIGLIGSHSAQSLQPIAHFEKQLNMRIHHSVQRILANSPVPHNSVRSTPPPQYKQAIKRRLHLPRKTNRSHKLTTRPTTRALHHPGHRSPRRLLSYQMLKHWAKDAPLNKLNSPYIEFEAPRAMMEARLNRQPLSLQNIRQIGRIRSLKNTPWARFHLQ